jgi:hypothetical protein
MKLQIEAAVYRLPEKCHALSIVKKSPHEIIVTVSVYDDIDGWVKPIQGYGPNPGLIDFRLAGFEAQMMNIARIFFGQRGPDDGTPACSDEDFATMLAKIMEFKP